MNAHTSLQRAALGQNNTMHQVHSRCSVPKATIRVMAISGGGRGFGESSGKHTKAQDEIKKQRQQQLVATDLIAKLLRADNNPKRVAEEHVDSLTEEFFQIGGAYLSMAEKGKRVSSNPTNPKEYMIEIKL